MKKCYGIVLMLWSCFLFCSNAYAQPSITVAVAANFRFAIEEIKEIFEKRTHIPVKLIIDSSGALTTKIENGAPFDVFMAANMAYPTYLYEKKFTIAKPEVYARGKLVLCSNVSGITGLDGLRNEAVKKIALADPKTAPYGKAAMDVLLKRDDYAQLKEKFVFGKSVSVVNQFIFSKNVEAGFTAKSAVISQQLNHRQTGWWMEIDSKAYSPISQGIVKLVYGVKMHEEETNSFYLFMFSPEVKTVLEKYGYESA